MHYNHAKKTGTRCLRLFVCAQHGTLILQLHLSQLQLWHTGNKAHFVGVFVEYHKVVQVFLSKIPLYDLQILIQLLEGKGLGVQNGIYGVSLVGIAVTKTLVESFVEELKCLRVILGKVLMNGPYCVNHAPAGELLPFHTHIVIVELVLVFMMIYVKGIVTNQ